MERHPDVYKRQGGYLDIGLIDTMEDLFVNFIGAVVFSIFGYFYVKKRGKMCIRDSFKGSGSYSCHGL